MQHVTAPFEQHLMTTLGISTRPKPWQGAAELPFFLGEQYAFFELNLLGTPCLLMLDSSDEQSSPTTVRKHLIQVQKKWHGEVVYVCSRLTSYHRRGLIEQRVSFVIPGNQLYLPAWGMDLREHFKALRDKPKRFWPSTQALLIKLLLEPSERSAIIPAQMAELFGVTRTTMKRAFDELEKAELVDIQRSGNARSLRLAGTRQETWARAQPWLRSPVRHRHHLAAGPGAVGGVPAGDSALAIFTMLAAPAHEVVALTGKQWKDLEPSLKQEVPKDEPGQIEVEVWRYAPLAFQDYHAVDPLSLYLSTEQTSDERVQQALEKLLEVVPW